MDGGEEEDVVSLSFATNTGDDDFLTPSELGKGKEARAKAERCYGRRCRLPEEHPRYSESSEREEEEEAT
jgi:hypothetical protein